MSGEQPGLDAECVVYRAVLRRQWIDEDSGEVKPDAFLRRPEVDEDGISVYVAGPCDPPSVASRFNRCEAVAALCVGDIRGLGVRLDVIPDPPESPDFPQHACITGLPYHDDDPNSAVYLAEKLAELAWFEYRRPRRG
jgi:hypothetical protein